MSKKGVTANEDKALWLAFHALEGTAEFNIISKWLADTKTMCQEKYLWATTNEERALRQGRLQMIAEILDTKENALEHLKS